MYSRSFGAPVTALADLIKVKRPERDEQGELALFASETAPAPKPTRLQLMDAVDALNRCFGRGAVTVASATRQRTPTNELCERRDDERASSMLSMDKAIGSRQTSDGEVRVVGDLTNSRRSPALPRMPGTAAPATAGAPTRNRWRCVAAVEH